jgi:Uma2 family endonuclease
MTAMTSRSEIAVPPGMYVPTADQRIVLYGKTWAEFEAQIALRGEDGRHPRLAFLDGAVELMSPSRGHEQTKTTLGTILELYCGVAGIEARGTGSWLLREAPKEAGAEPDESYIFGPSDDVSRPHLVIEVVWTHGGIDKLEIYRRLEIPEVWFWEDDAIAIYRLVDGVYERAERSRYVPDFDLALACELLQTHASINEIHRRVREAVAR